MIRERYIQIDRGLNGVLYEPEVVGEKSQIAILVMHSDADYLSFDMGREMAKRGYRVLCANVRDKNSIQDAKMMDVKAAVEFLRELSAVETVILMGHSGGATLMSAYQSVAENGPKVFQDQDKIVKCPDSLAGLPAADGVLLLDSNWGNAAMMLLSLDPAVMIPENGQKLDSGLDLFHPDNGFRPGGTTFGEEFIRTFQQAQGERNNRLIDYALERLQKIEKGEGNYVDDEPFVIPGAAQSFFNNRLFAQDIRLLSHTKKEWPLLHGDGSMSCEVVHSVRGPENDRSFTASYRDGALVTTIRNFLTSYAVRTTESYGYDESGIYGIDYASSYNCPPGNVSGISVPLLIMGMTAGWEYLASETIYEHAKSEDKELIFTEGATHLFDTAKHCETYPGQFGDTKKTTYDYVDKWLSKKGRFSE